MKVPEFMFALVNPIMTLLLKSPLHGIVSKSLMVISFTGRKSGKAYSTPVRYLPYEGNYLCFSSTDTQWWRNLRDGAEASLLIRGEVIECRTEVIENDPPKVKEWLLYYLDLFPQDAVYHDIKLNKDKTLDVDDLERAAQHGVVVTATPINRD